MIISLGHLDWDYTEQIAESLPLDSFRRNVCDFLLFLKTVMEMDVDHKAMCAPGLRYLAGKEDLSQQEMLSWALLVLWTPRQAFLCCIEALVTSFNVDHGRLS